MKHTQFRSKKYLKSLSPKCPPICSGVGMLNQWLFAYLCWEEWTDVNIYADEKDPRIGIDVHYNDVTMSLMASQITSLTIVYSTVYSGADQRKLQSSASPAYDVIMDAILLVIWENNWHAWRTTCESGTRKYSHGLRGMQTLEKSLLARAQPEGKLEWGTYMW